MSNDDVIVLDCGSSKVYGGIAGEEAPFVYFPSCIGKPKYSPVMISDKIKSCYIGSEAIKLRSILNLNYPIKNGIIKNWDLMEILLEFTFQEISKIANFEIPQSSQSILFVDSILQSISQKTQLMQLSFEKYGFSGYSSSPEPLLSIYAHGKVLATSLSLGEGVIQVLPVYCCYVDEKSMRRINFGGGNVVDHMIRILRGSNRFLEKDRKLVEEIIHKVGYVALEYEERFQPSDKYATYELPDGQVLKLSQECCECNEILFNPGMAQYDFPGIVDLLIDSLNSVDIDTRHQLYDQIVISGGLSKTRGLSDRIQHDLKKVTPDSNYLRVISQLGREHAAWTGGSILGYVQAFSEVLITKSEYEEYGAHSVFCRKKKLL